tara:strand:+ start:421 stop:2088 length:1668 start_codon:yes stop_codon:yes gene_type:complete
MADYFNSPNAGQNRRAWLNGLLGSIGDSADYYLGPTGVPDRARSAGQIADMVSPVSGTLRSMDAAGRGNYGEAAIEGVGVLAPAAIAARFGAPAAKAVVETMTGTGNALADTGRRITDAIPSDAIYAGRSLAGGDMRGVLDAISPGRPAQGLGADAVKPSVAEMRRQANIERFGYDPNDVPAPAPPAGSGILSDYASQHQAPTRDGGAPAFNLAGDIYPDDIYSSKAVQYYGTGSDTMDKETMRLLQSLRGSPDADVTIYRAVPRGVDNLNAGDWVTVNKQYAKDHGESALGGDFDVIEKNVKASDIFTNGDSIHEFGYDPSSPSLPAPRNAAEAVAKDVLGLRAAGRASEVTDEMMAAADDQYMYFNTPIDMGVAERVRRSEDMGADPFGDYYHGTAREGYVDTTDIVGFEPGRVGDRWNADKRGFSMTSALQDANYYAVRGDSSKGNLGDGMIYPLVDMSKKPMRMIPPDKYSGTIGTWDERPSDTYSKLDAGGYDAVDIYDDGVSMRVSMDPTNIRSRFARFDPEFRHLRNLSAGVGGLGLLSQIPLQEEQY